MPSAGYARDARPTQPLNGILVLSDHYWPEQAGAAQEESVRGLNDWCGSVTPSHEITGHSSAWKNHASPTRGGIASGVSWTHQKWGNAKNR